MDCVYLKTSYESTVHWRTVTDILRCNPSWKGEPRFDVVIVNDGDSGTIFCRLVRIFTYTAPEETRMYALALVQPLNASGGTRPGDSELGLCRIRAKPRSQTRVLPARAIIRGALVIEDPTHRDEFTVVDTIDTDMFLRCMPLFPNRDTVNVY